MKIYGKVQGVFFRYELKKLADELQVKGFAKNNRIDGTLDVLAEGSNWTVDKIIDFCKKGPKMSRVDNVQIKEEKPRGDYTKFEII